MSVSEGELFHQSPNVQDCHLFFKEKKKNTGKKNALPAVVEEYGFLSVCAVTPIGEPYSIQHTGEMRGSSELAREAARDR